MPKRLAAGRGGTRCALPTVQAPSSPEDTPGRHTSMARNPGHRHIDHDQSKDEAMTMNPSEQTSRLEALAVLRLMAQDRQKEASMMLTDSEDPVGSGTRRLRACRCGLLCPRPGTGQSYGGEIDQRRFGGGLGGRCLLRLPVRPDAGKGVRVRKQRQV